MLNTMAHSLGTARPVLLRDVFLVRPCRSIRPRFVTSKAGFGGSSKNAKSDASQSKKKVDPKQELGGGRSPAKATTDFVPAGDLSDFPDGKATKVADMPGLGTVVLYRHKGVVYASTVYSTAYQFPMVDAAVMDGPTGQPVAEVPLDGTQYDLRTGKVLKWCPSEGGNLLRGLLSTLKRNASPQDLQMYETVVDAGGKIFVKVGVP